LAKVAVTSVTFWRHEEPHDAWLPNWSKWYSTLALDNTPILWHAIGLAWFVMTCYGTKSEFADACWFFVNNSQIYQFSSKFRPSWTWTDGPVQGSAKCLNWTQSLTLGSQNLCLNWTELNFGITILWTCRFKFINFPLILAHCCGCARECNTKIGTK
jgi:hypothetical protein